MIEVKEIQSRKDLKAFATYPLKLYKGCPYYVPSIRGDEMNTFNRKKNLSLENCDIKGFLCYKDGELVGRIVGLISHTYNKLSGKKYIRFSRFECIDDIEVFKALLGAVEKFGRENGMELMHGPWGFNDTDREGMLTDGFDKRSTYATNYYYPYFSERMKELGFMDESKWIEKSFVIPEQSYERVVNLADKLKQKLKVVDIAETMPLKKIIKQYGKKIFATINEAYGHLDAYVPLEGKLVDSVLSQFGTVCNVRYMSIIIDENDECVAFGIVLPSICDALIKHKGRLFPFGFIDVLKSIKKPKELEMALIGVKHSYKNSGIHSIVMTRIMRNVIDDKIEHIESNPMLETNYQIQQNWKFAKNEIVKRRQTYQKPIGSLIEEK